MDSFPKCNFYSINLKPNPIVAMLFKQQGRRIYGELELGYHLLQKIYYTFKSFNNSVLPLSKGRPRLDIISRYMTLYFRMSQKKSNLIQNEALPVAVRNLRENEINLHEKWNKLFKKISTTYLWHHLMMKNVINTIICLSSFW